MKPPEPLLHTLFIVYIAVFAVAWALYDARNLGRLRADDPDRRDKRFGYWTGIAVAVAGLIEVIGRNL